MRVLLVRLLSDRRGATAIEYGLIAAFIAVALVGALPRMRKSIVGLFSTVNNQVNYAQKVAGS